MAASTVPVSGRNTQQSPLTAGGGFTLPQQAFIPHQSTQPLTGTGTVQDAVSRGMGGAGPSFGLTQHGPNATGALPGTLFGRAFGVRTQVAQVQLSTSWI